MSMLSVNQSKIINSLLQTGFGKERGVKHKALITEINRRGFFVELTNTLARGFVNARTLPVKLVTDWRPMGLPPL